jgi:Na+/melibiose symporter-like transporter
VAPPPTEPVYEERIRPAKTSAAAAFALVFGVSALLSVLTVIVGPVGIVLAIVGIILGIVGIRNAKRVGVTGRGVAIGGLVLSVVALLIAAALAAGISFYLNDEQAVDRLEQRVEQLRDQLPDDVNIPQP